MIERLKNYDMKEKLIGRIKEQEKLASALNSNSPEMVAIIGRRRIGKTFLVRSFFGNRIDLEVTGAQHAGVKEQLENFGYLLHKLNGDDQPFSIPYSWGDAFRKLITALEKLPKVKRKRIIFFDELPWLASKRSGFLSAFGYFWNNWASKQNIIVIICGSAASWMIDKVVNNKGGLHNRITKRIFLKPFNLPETEVFFKERDIHFDRIHLLNIYMVMGGVPHYLQEVKAGKSAMQNIEDICFREDGLLGREFSNLYPALFEKSENHIAVIRALASKWKGLNRKEIIQITKLSNGGGLSKVLNELSASGFITIYRPFGKKKKDLLYRLTDEYSLFYLHFIEPHGMLEIGGWQRLSQTQTFKSWRGYAFENVCLNHIPQIKKALRISGIYSEASSFYFKGNEDRKGIQIDLLIDRNDQTINICELKFYNSPFTITKDYALKLRTKLATFKEVTKTRKHLFLTFITAYGLAQNKYSLGLVDNDFGLDILFEEE
jgi:AAA+ ATPase superfamily predicted ATPase